MNSNHDFVAYEYKNITVKRDSVTIYTDCLSNFGWTLVDEREHGFQPTITNAAQLLVHAVTPVPTSVAQTENLEMVSLKFKRNRCINHKLEIDRLERACEEALSSIGSLERKNNAFIMGISLGAGIIGTAVLGLAVYSFISSNAVIGVLLSVLGAAGWGIGFFANRRMGQKRSIRTEPMIQAQLDVAYGACERAHAILAS